MKNHIQFRKITTLLVIFILLIYLTECTSTRISSTSSLPKKSSRYEYVIHGEKIKFLLDKKSTISNNILSGKIKRTYFDNSFDGGNKFHLYLRSDSVIKLDNKGEYLTVPLIHVKKVEEQEVHGVWASLILTSLALVVFVGAASVQIGGF